jgi:hypothetical protein
VLETVFVLLESPSPSRRFFIGSHSLPPLWFAVSVLHNARTETLIFDVVDIYHPYLVIFSKGFMNKFDAIIR